MSNAAATARRSSLNEVYANAVLACGYHGWSCDHAGRVVRLPQRPLDEQGRITMAHVAFV